MNKMQLLEVLNETTYLIIDGASKRRTHKLGSLLWGVALSPSDKRVAGLQRVDCSVALVGVNAKVAHTYLNDLVSILDEYPDPATLQDGPSYKQVAEVVGDEATALRLFGLGHVLDLWEVLTPVDFNVEPALREEAADIGMVVISGYPSCIPYRLAVAAG